MATADLTTVTALTGRAAAAPVSVVQAITPDGGLAVLVDGAPVGGVEEIQVRAHPDGSGHQVFLVLHARAVDMLASDERLAAARDAFHRDQIAAARRAEDELRRSRTVIPPGAVGALIARLTAGDRGGRD